MGNKEMGTDFIFAWKNRQTISTVVGRKIKSVPISFLFALLLTQPARAGVTVHGFLQGNYDVNTAAANPDGGDFKWAEERMQLKLEAATDPLQLFVKADAFYDHVEAGADVELREGYIDHAASLWDVRVGRQVLTWGVGDLVFINDVFPKDYEAFFSGRPLEYLKKGVDGIRLGAYPSFASFELVATPFFTPNRFPDPGRFRMFDPLPGVADRTSEEPARSFANTEVALRAFRRIADFDASLYFYRGFYRQPAMLPDNPVTPTRLTLFYPELAVYGASLQGNALDGVLSLEAGYYDSREDGQGTDPMIPNSQLRFLIGYQKQVWEEGTLGIQYYSEIMRDYSGYAATLPSGFPQERREHGLASVRLTQFFRHQTLRLSWFSFISPADGDYLLNPEIKYNFTDHIWASAGAMVFGGGEQWSQFGQLESNDNLYSQIRYEW